ncbi:hypothetical protein ACFY8O_28120 [Streptomyces argenteolus]|uniref:Uncharacterized protein n=1 Tax=Streptomyces argenteolus TaxID=67274 RepID=A0ABW6XDI5_9ACTN
MPLGAFRAAAHREATLTEPVTCLDGRGCWGTTEPGEGDQSGETFLTAAALHIPDQPGRVHMIDCGTRPRSCCAKVTSPRSR